MKKRILSLLMAFVMAVGLLPASALAADSMTVYVTISDKGVLAADKNGEPMGYRAITVTDQDSDGKLTIYDAYTAAHNQYCDSEFLVNGSGLVGQLWGDRSGSFLTFVNNAGISGASLQERVIGDGDHLVGAILSDTSYWSDYISFFDSQTKTVSVGEEVALTLKGRAGMSWTGEDGPDAALSGLSVGTWNNGSFSAIDGKTTDENGQVTLFFDTAGTYYVTANGSVQSNSSTTGRAPIIAPVCIVTVTEEKTDEEYVATDKAALNVTYTHGQDLSLPNKGQSGKTTITWTSDNMAVISNAGVITLPEEDTTVTLTATIKCNEETDTKEILLTVPGRLNGAKAMLEAATLRPVEFTNATDSGYKYLSAAQDTNILDVARTVVNGSNVTVALAESFTPTAVIAADGTITYPTDEAKTITLPLKLTYNGQAIEVSVSAVIPKHAQTKAEAIDAMKTALDEYMKDPKVLNGNTSLDEVKTTLLLPGGKSSGLYIKWTSSNTKVIANQTSYSKIVSSHGHPTNGYYEAAIMRPGGEDATVTLTAELTYRSTSVDLPAGPLPDAAVRKISFTIKVPALTASERQAILDGAANDIKIFDKDGAVADITNIKDNLYFPQYNGFTTKWTTDIAGISIPSSGYGKATVTRPEKDEDDLVGTITLTITAGEVEATKIFDAKVLAWTEEDLTAAQNQLNQVAEALTFDVIKGDNTSASSIHSNLFLKRFASFADGTISLEHMTKSDANAWPVAITWGITPNDGPITYNDKQANKGTGIVTTPAQEAEVILKATIDYRTPIAGVNAVEKTIAVTVLSAESQAYRNLMDNIAATYDDNDDTGEWVILDMGAYTKLFPDAAAKTSAAAKQTYINGVVSMLTTGKNLNGSDASAGDYAKSILALHAVGIDPSQLYGVNSNTILNTCAKLKGMSYDSHYSAPYVLLANQFGDVGLSDEQTASLVALLKNNQMESGLFGYKWGGETFTDLDTTAAAVAGLAGLYNTNTDAKTVVDKAITGLSEAQTETGSFGNANSDAMVIIGLAAMGINPDTDSRFIKEGNSVLDGLLRYAAAGNDGFGYTDNRADALATEQGFRALMAAYGVMSTGTAYNVYDFSGNTLGPGRATGTGSVEKPTDPIGDNITVTLTIKSDTSYWLRSKAVSLPGTDATVYHALVKGLEGSGITQVGAETGYVKSMTKNGTTLEEFGSGKNAGWMYKVNGELPEVGLTDCEIENGDVIVWFYTEDWTSVPGTGGLGSGNQEETEETPAVQFTDVSEGDYYYDAVRWAVEKGITTGTGEDTFHPNASCTRSQMVTFLWRAAGEPAAKTSDCVFTDVDKDAYYYEALLWAVENGITTGTSETKFSPDGDCTRGQMAVFLHRSAETPAVSDGHSFSDVKADAYYSDAVTWAAAEGITIGTSETTFHPNGDCTRGQMVTFLMRYLETIA